MMKDRVDTLTRAHVRFETAPSRVELEYQPFTFVEVLQSRASWQAQRRAFTFLADGERAEIGLTYGQLDCQARAIAARLQRVAAPGERALLLYPAGLDFVAAFFGCLYAGVIAVPLYPPHPARQHRSHARLQAVAADADAALALTTAALLPSAQSALDGAGARTCQWLATDEVDSSLADQWRSPCVTSDTLAFLQYTSGSTSTPKGVMVSHANLLSNSAILDAGWDHTPESVLVSWLPHFHDMGLIYGILQPIYKGFACVLMSPAAFTQQPYRWLSTIDRFRATHSAAPNFAYDACVQKVTLAQRASLDLRSWRMALNGAEPVRAATLERFTEAFASCGFEPRSFCPGYGLAEGTLKVSALPARSAPVFRSVDAAALEQHRVVARDGGVQARTLVASGVAALDTEIVIVDPQRRIRCGPDEVGEIWVGGSSVARGYWRRPSETTQTFEAYLADTGDGPFLRTGDLGFLDDGHLFVTGRLKDMIIVDGRNYYPQDIEHAAEQSHPAVRPHSCAAFATEVDGQDRLVVVAEIDRRFRPADEQGGLDSREVIRAIRRTVAEQSDVPVFKVQLLKIGSVPKTSSGKIQRQACRAAFEAGSLPAWEA